MRRRDAIFALGAVLALLRRAVRQVSKLYVITEVARSGRSITYSEADDTPKRVFDAKALERAVNATSPFRRRL